MSSRYGFYNNMADVYISLGYLYEKTGEYERAILNVKQAIQYSTLLENDFMLMRSWLSLGKLQNMHHLENDAIISLRTCLSVATEKFGDAFFLHQVYRELGKAYAAMGDYKNSYESFLTYDRLKDSVFTAESDQRVAKLQTKGTGFGTQLISLLTQQLNGSMQEEMKGGMRISFAFKPV